MSTMTKSKCPCASGAAINYELRSGVPGVMGYDGPAEVVSSFHTNSGASVVLAKCASCHRVPMGRGDEKSAAMTWVALSELSPEECTFYRIEEAS